MDDYKALLAKDEARAVRRFWPWVALAQVMAALLGVYLGYTIADPPGNWFVSLILIAFYSLTVYLLLVEAHRLYTEGRLDELTYRIERLRQREDELEAGE